MGNILNDIGWNIARIYQWLELICLKIHASYNHKIIILR